MERRRLLSALVVQNTADSGPNSLRWAIEQANALGAGTTPQIDFQLTGTGPWTIPLASPLPAVDVPVILDGTTQAGYRSSPLVEIDGSHVAGGAAADGLVLTAGSSTVRGLSLVGFSGAAIVLQGGGQDVVAGNYVGLDPTGASGKGNGTGIEVIGSSFNTVGVDGVVPGNVISGNVGDGVWLGVGSGGASTQNILQGNLIGPAPDGVTAPGNGGDGVDVQGVGSNSIGMPGPGFGNVISGNVGAGIELAAGAAGNAIQGNDVGVAADGRSALGNQGDGIRLDDAPGTTIGGTDPDHRNVIGGNLGDGIASYGASAGLLIAGNAIGTDASGQVNLGNQQNGINLDSSSATVGGTNGGAANVIADNGGGTTGAGVLVGQDAAEDSILSNSITGNEGLGINFGDGVTSTHDPGTPGPNDYQNYPVFSLAKDDGATTRVIGGLFESPDTTYLIQLFSNRHADPSGYGQGQTLLESTTVETDGTGNGTFQVDLPPDVAPGMFLSATATDPAGNTSEFSQDIAVQGVPNLVLSGTATPDPVAAGAEVTIRLQVTNIGTADANSVVLADQLPTNSTLVSATITQGNALPFAGPGMAQFFLSTIAAGSTVTAQLVVRTDPATLGVLDDVATLTSQEAPNPRQETIPVTVEPSADLSVSMAEDTTPALVGGELTYTITTTNRGPQTAPHAQVVLPIAPGLSVVSAGSTMGTATASGGEVVASLGDLSAGSQAVVTVVVRAGAVGPVTETATATSGALQSGPAGDNVASVTTDVLPASDLSVALVASSGAAEPGIAITYTLTVANAGPLDATSVTVQDTLPADVSLVPDANGTGPTPTFSGNLLTYTLATLAAGTSVSFSIAVSPDGAPGTSLVDSATVQGAQADPDRTNNAAQVTTPVIGLSDLSIAGVAPASGVDVGRPFQIKVTVANAGPYDEPDAVLTAALPDGLAIARATSGQGAAPSAAQGTFTLDLGPLASGQSVVVTLEATAGPSDAGTLLVPFSVQGRNLDTDPANDAWTASLDVTPLAELGVAIAPGGGGPAIPGKPWSYTVQVSNAGPSTADGVLATIPVPAGSTFVSARSSQGSTPGVPGPGDLVAVDLGSIAAGGSASVTVSVQPSIGLAGGSIGLQAQASATDQDPANPIPSAALAVPVAPAVRVSIAMASTPGAVLTGQVVTFTASVTNTGTSTATGVVVAFPVLGGLQLLGSSPSQGMAALATDQWFARLGDLAPGVSAMVTVRELAVSAGAYTLTASVAADQYNLGTGSSSATAQVVESPGTIELGTGSLQVTDLSGVAVFPVVRLFGAAGTVTVRYQTSPIDATPGVDFTPTYGTLTLGPGQWSGSIAVPVLNNPYLNHDTHLTLTIDTPTGGAALGPTTATQLLIRDANPDTTPPAIAGLSWSGTPRWIESLVLQFTAPLDPAHATEAADYLLTSTAGAQPVPIASISYDPATFAVTIVPAAPIPSGRYDRIQVVGTGPSAIRDLAGNFLDGNGNGNPGSDYVALFAQGRKLRYVDGRRNLVRLAIRGRGYLHQVLDASGNGVSLDIVGMVPNRTTLTGHVKPIQGGSGQTQIGQVSGLGQFGNVKVLLKTPPFLVSSFPFQRRNKLML